MTHGTGPGREPVLLPLPSGDLSTWAGQLISVLQPVIARLENALDILSIYDLNGNEVVGPNGVNIYSTTGRVIFQATGGFDLMYDDLATTLQDLLVRPGQILQWSGSIASIPSGWALCDGTQGTPNLQDKFIVAAGSTYPVATTGGQDSVSLVSANLAQHGHKYIDRSSSITTSTVNLSYSTGTTAQTVVTAVTLASSLATATSSPVGTASEFDNRPQYYALAYIMKL